MGHRVGHCLLLALTATMAWRPALAVDLPEDSMEVAGVVLDSTSKEPLWGAWVLLSFHDVRTDGLFVAGNCVSTLGTTTAADGKFRFVVSKRRGIGGVSAIRPGYFMVDIKQPSNEQWKARDQKAFSGFKIYLKPQNPAHPEWHGDPDASCPWAKTREDVAASDRYLEIQLEDFKRYGGGADRIRVIQNLLDQHKSLQGFEK